MGGRLEALKPSWPCGDNGILDLPLLQAAYPGISSKDHPLDHVLWGEEEEQNYKCKHSPETSGASSFTFLKTVCRATGLRS